MHDPLLAAVFRGLGRDARSTPVPGRDELLRGRALLPRGYPLSTPAFAGALLGALDHPLLGVEAHPIFLVIAGVAPGVASDYATALRRAGRPDVRLVTLGADPPSWRGAADELGIRCDARASVAVLRALAAADVINRAGHEARARASQPAVVDPLLRQAVGAAADLLASRRSPEPVLASLGEALRRLRRARRRSVVRVSLAGDPFCVLTDGPLAGDIVSWLEQRGARVEPPAVLEWVLELARRARLEGVVRCGRMLYRRYARLVRLSRGQLDDPAETARAVGRVCGDGPQLPLVAHQVLATYLRVAREGSAELVLAVDPFLSTVSSAVTAALVHTLARRSGPRFLALELSGDAEAQLESRLDLAVDLALPEA